MAVISDSNILSSLACANALPLLLKLYATDSLYIPPSVEKELHIGLQRGKTYISHVFNLIQQGHIQVLPLTEAENALSVNLHPKLHDGKREGLAICQLRHHSFLSNDRRAVHYCYDNNIDVVNLELLLRLFWLHKITSKHKIKAIISFLSKHENLVLKPKQIAFIFAPDN